MNTWNIAQTAAHLGQSTRNIRRMVAAMELPAVPGSGGQGRALSFDSRVVRDYATNADLADLLARMLYAVRTGQHIGRCAGYWKTWYYAEGHPRAGERKRHGLEYLAARLPKDAPDKLAGDCRTLCAQLGRRHCEYLMAALVVSTAQPTGRGRRVAPERISWAAIRKRAGKKSIWLDRATRFWHHAPRMVMERSAEDRAQVSDTDLLHAIRLSPFPKGKHAPAPAIRAQVYRICNALNVKPSWLRQEAARLYQQDTGRGHVPPAAAVGRVLGMKRAQAARLVREIGPLPAWYLSAFASPR